jgi:hypothetical protein
VKKSWLGMRFFSSLLKKRSKKLSLGVGQGFDRTDMPTSFVLWDICKGSDITDGSLTQ